MVKIVKLTLLFSLLALIIFGGVMQTPYAQEKLRAYLVEKSAGTLQIGKLKGILPFHVHLTDVVYDDGSTSAHLDEVSLWISPGSLFFGRLSLFRLHVNQAHIVTTEVQSAGGKRTWPEFTLPIFIHSLKIDDLTFNSLEGVSIAGMGELSENFSLHISLSYEGAVVRLNIDGDEREKQIAVVTHIRRAPLGNIWLSGVYDWEGNRFTGEARGSVFDRPINLPLSYGDEELTIGEARYNIHSHHFIYKGIEGTIDPTGAIALTFETTRIEGELTATFAFDPLTFTLNIDNLILLDPQYEVFPTTTLTLSGETKERRLQLEGEVQGLGEQPFRLAGDIPFSRLDPFSLSLQGKGSIDPLLAFLENALLIAKGDLDVDLTLSGTWDAVQISGNARFMNGELESLITGTVYRDIAMQLEGEGQELKITSLTARDLDRGTLTGKGQIAWDLEAGFPFSLTLDTKRFTLLAIDPLTTNVDANITLSGTIHDMTLSGEARIVEGHLAIPNKMPTQVPTLDVTYVNRCTPEIEVKIPKIPIHWDLDIDIPRHFTIEGRGLTSEWRGSMHIGGSQHAPTYNGKLKLVQGRFTIIGRTFDLTAGKITIEGLKAKDIYVDIKGDLELAAITASIVMTGSLDATHLTFTSNPPMSTNQILSWILFNQNVDELTPFQACRLANTLVSLSGKYAGPRVFDNIKEGLGIDVFDITHCDIDSADLTFQVGKYISQGTFVGVSKSLSGDYDSVLIQARLYRDFYIEGNYGGSLNGLTPNGGKMIFKWYKSY